MGSNSFKFYRTIHREFSFLCSMVKPFKNHSYTCPGLINDARGIFYLPRSRLQDLPQKESRTQQHNCTRCC